MSPNKRKAIVFDLEDDSKRRKVSHKGGGAAVQFTPRNSRSGNDDEEVPENYVSFMQPEVLTVPFMMEHLEQVQISSSSVAGKSRKEVEKLFLKHITPKPQRTYKSNQLGKKLTLLQRRRSSLKPEWSGMVMESKADRKSSLSSPSGGSAGTLSRELIPSVGDRLKAPPPKSLINTERKTIKLSSSKSSPSSTIDNILKKSSTGSGQSPQKTEDSTSGVKRNIISLSKPTRGTDETSPKKLKLNADDKISTPENPKKHASVSWP